MDESNYYLMNRNHIPAFGSWDCNDDFPIPFTECFESARQADLFRYSYSDDRDLYVAGDLYKNDIVTPAMILLPRRKRKVSGNEVGGKKEAWMVRDYEYDVKKAATPSPPPLPPPARAIDEDLYRISPDLLYSKPKRKGVRGLFSMCLRPTCAS